MTHPLLMHLDHVGIAVRSIEAALPFYTRGIGVAPSHTEDVASQGARTCFIEVGDAHIEFLEPLSEDTPIGKFLQKRGEGVHHLAFRVRDIEAALARVAAEGFTLIDKEPRPGARGSRVAFIHPKGTHGVLYELVERP